MKRRIVSIISILAVICTLFQVPVLAAKTSVDASKLSVLRSLEILDEELPKRVTYDIFVNALMGFVSEGEERGIHTPESFVRHAGMIDEKEAYKGNEALAFDDAVKYSVILLGYNKTFIPNINYNQIAGSENLLKGVSVKDTLSPADMVVLLYNLLDAEMIEVDTLSDKGILYNPNGESTLISTYRDIYVCKGIVTADEFTSIYSEQGTKDGAISIGQYTFDLDCEYDRALMGCNVIAYVKDNGEDVPTVVYINEAEGRNERFIVWDKDIVSVNDSFTVLEYEDEKERIKKAKLAEHPKVLINGVFYGDYTKEDLMPENGYIEFVDNNGDGKYEILNVKAYQTFVVDSVNADKKIIKNEFDFTGDLRLEDVAYTIIKDEKQIQFNEIAIGDILSVAMSRNNGEKVCEILVSSERKKFTVSKTQMAEREIYDGSDMYLLSADYIRYAQSEGKEIRLGGAYDFYIDAFGKIAYFKAIPEDFYALFLQARRNADDEVYVRYLDVDGVWNDTLLAKKTTLDLVTQEADKMYGALSVMDPQVVKIKFDTEGKVKVIKTATEYEFHKAKRIDDIFTVTKEMTHIYRPLYSTFENVLYLKNSSRLFVMPKDANDKYNKEMYYVASASSYFVEQEFTVRAYDVDRYGYAEILSIKGTNETKRMPDNIFVVTGIKSVLDQYGEPCMRLVGCGSGYKDISFLTDGTNVLKGVEKGDVINFMLDNSGRISEVSKPPHAKLQGPFEKQNEGGTGYYPIHYINATIAEIDFESGRIILNYGEENEEVTFPFTSTINCMQYNVTTQECDLINYDSFTKNDKVMVVTKHYGIRDMIRICE